MQNHSTSITDASSPNDTVAIRDLASNPATEPVITSRSSVAAFTTKDGSTIREIMASRNTGGVIQKQSLAEATLEPGSATTPHYHPQTEEIYYILQGAGFVRVGYGEGRTVSPGDCVAIAPGAPHQITNTHAEPLVFLCCCAPPYTHEDTVLIAPDWYAHPPVSSLPASPSPTENAQ